MNAISKLTAPTIPQADCPSCNGGHFLSGHDHAPDRRECTDCINGICHGDLAEAVNIFDAYHALLFRVIDMRDRNKGGDMAYYLNSAIDALETTMTDDWHSSIIHMLRREHGL